MFAFCSISYSQVVFVNQTATGNNNGTTWADAFTNLQDALAIAQVNDEIWIAQGIYLPTSTTDRSISFRPSTGVKLLGGFNGSETLATQRDWATNPTILSGDIGNSDLSDNSYSVVVTIFNNIELNGLIIERGFASVIDNTDVSKRTGAGIFNIGNNSVINCIIRNNVATTGTSSTIGLGGGIITFGGTFNIINTLIISNFAQSGCAFSAEAGDISIINCTFTFNSNTDASVITVFQANVNVHNTIFAFNMNNGLLINNLNNFAVTHSLFDSDFPIGIFDAGNNIINTFPMFTNPGTNDFTLQVNSPAIDVGNMSNTETKDLANNTRISDGDSNGTATIDLGAYELLIIDNNPIAICQDIIIELDNNGNGTITASQIDNGSTDDIGIDTLNLDITTFNCTNIGVNSVTLTVTDTNSNTDTCTATVTVEDNLAPIVTCPDDLTIDPGAGGTPFIVTDISSFTGFFIEDNCTDLADLIFTQDPIIGTVLNDGVYTINVTVSDLSSNTTNCSFILTVDSTLSTDSEILENSITLYPNPSLNKITIESKINNVKKVSIYDMLGKLIIITNKKNIDISNLAIGSYFVKIEDDKNSHIVKKFIKK